MATFVFILVAYLIGSLSFAVIVSRAFGLPDPHTYGSGNPGATNVLRTGRTAAALLTLIGDGAKGWLAVFLAMQLGPAWGLAQDSGGAGMAGVALAVFIGHLYPVFFGFRGGKGVATALGVLLDINPWLGLGTLGTWLVIAFLFRISSLAAIAGHHMVTYEVSKMAVNRLTTVVAAGNAKHNVRCNVIMPGLMDTPMAITGIAAASGKSVETLRAERNSRVPMGRMGSGWDTAYAALFLCSDEARFITGAILPVDGGTSVTVG